MFFTRILGCGSFAREKRIPSLFLNLPLDRLACVLRGYYEEAIGFWTNAIIARAENAPEMATNWDPNYFINLLNSIDYQLREDLGLDLTFKLN